MAMHKNAEEFARLNHRLELLKSKFEITGVPTFNRIILVGYRL
jgi:hypothetical protein